MMTESGASNVVPLRRRMPVVRSECVDGPRPCPHTACRYHLFDTVTRAKRERLDAGAEQMVETCALDVADRGVSRLEQVAEILGSTRQLVQMIEARAVARLKARTSRSSLGALREHWEDLDAREESLSPLASIVDSESTYKGGHSEPDRDPDEPIGPSRFADASSTDESDCGFVWRLYDRECREREAKARGEYLEVRGVPVSPTHARVLRFLGDRKSPDGRGATFLEIAEGIGVEGESSMGRSASARNICLPLRELGVIGWDRTSGVRIVDGSLIGAPAPVNAAPHETHSEEPMDLQASIVASVRAKGTATVKELAEGAGLRIDLVRRAVDGLIDAGALRRNEAMRLEIAEPVPVAAPIEQPAAEKADHDRGDRSPRDEIASFVDVEDGRSIDELVERFGWKNTETARARLTKIKKDGAVVNVAGRWYSPARAPVPAAGDALTAGAVPLTVGQAAIFETVRAAVARGQHPGHNELANATGRSGVYDILHSLRAAGMLAWETADARGIGKRFRILRTDYVQTDAKAGAFRRARSMVAAPAAPPAPIVLAPAEAQHLVAESEKMSRAFASRESAAPAPADPTVDGMHALLKKLEGERDEARARVEELGKKIDAVRAFLTAFAA